MITYIIIIDGFRTENATQHAMLGNKSEEDKMLQGFNVAVKKENEGDVAVRFAVPATFLLSPHYEYSIKLYDHFLRIHSNVYDHKIQYSDIRCHYLLEYPNDNDDYIFIICLNKPIIQREQTYLCLAWKFESTYVRVDVNLTEEEIEERLKGLWLHRKKNFEWHNLTEPLFVDNENLLKVFQPVMSGLLHGLIAKIFKALTGKQIFSHSRTYLNTNHHQCVDCAHSGRNGLLYPNDKSFIFLQEVLHCSFV